MLACFLASHVSSITAQLQGAAFLPDNGLVIPTNKLAFLHRARAHPPSPARGVRVHAPAGQAACHCNRQLCRYDQRPAGRTGAGGSPVAACSCMQTIVAPFACVKRSLSVKTAYEVKCLVKLLPVADTFHDNQTL